MGTTNNDGATHAKGCYSWGPQHYACALAEINRRISPTHGMTVMDLADDDALRFVQRVLESDAPAADRQFARDMVVAIRTRLRTPNVEFSGG